MDICERGFGESWVFIIKILISISLSRLYTSWYSVRELAWKTSKGGNPNPLLPTTSPTSLFQETDLEK